MYFSHFCKDHWALGYVLKYSGDSSCVFSKYLSLRFSRQLLEQQIYLMSYTRYQVPFNSWQIKSVLKLCKVCHGVI